jgi:hypothetical protein
MTTQEKHRVRNLAKAKGRRLENSSAAGRYMLVSMDYNVVELESATLEEIEEYLKPLAEPAVRNMHPLPETPEAIARGCRCRVFKSADGSQLYNDGRLPQFFTIEKGCPIHG